MNRSGKKLKKWDCYADYGSFFYFLLYTGAAASVFLASLYSDSPVLFLVSILVFAVALCFILIHINRVVVTGRFVSVSRLLLMGFIFRSEDIDGIQIFYKERKKGKLYCAGLNIRNGQIFLLYQNRSLANLMETVKETAAILSCRVTGGASPALFNSSRFTYAGPKPFAWRLDATKILLLIILLLPWGIVFFMQQTNEIDSQFKKIQHAEIAFSQKAAPVVQKAQKMADEFDTLPVSQQHLVQKVVIHFPDNSRHPIKNSLWKTRDWTEMTTTQPGDIKTVVLVEFIDDDWGDAKGTIVLLDEKKKFWFNVSSGVKKRQLTTEIEAYPYIDDYLESLENKYR